jgi:hypothetical protein
MVLLLGLASSEGVHGQLHRQATRGVEPRPLPFHADGTASKDLLLQARLGPKLVVSNPFGVVDNLAELELWWTWAISIVAAGILAASMVTTKVADNWVAGIAKAGCLKLVVSTTGFVLAIGIAVVEVKVIHLGLAAGIEVAADIQARILQ